MESNIQFIKFFASFLSLHAIFSGVHGIAGASTTDWMSNVPGSTLLTSMTIPGTHDTMARYGVKDMDTLLPDFFMGAKLSAKVVNAFTKPYAACQDWSLTKQLNNGIRFIDIRLRPMKNSFTIHHGPVYQNAVFGEVLRDVKNFLTSHPTETVLISYQDESKGPNLNPGPNAGDFETILRGYLNNNRYKSKIYNKYQVSKFWGCGYGVCLGTTLDEVRGKMVFIDKEGHGGFGFPKDIISVEDKYEDVVDGFKLGVGSAALTSIFNLYMDEMSIKPLKKNGITNHMWRASGGNGNKFYLTFCSANDFNKAECPHCGQSNRWISDQINPYVETYIRNQKVTGKTYGIVIFDFPNIRLIKSLIEHNPGVPRNCAILQPEDKKTSMNIRENYMNPYMGDFWNDNIGYIHLSKGCYLTAYVDDGYGGTKNYLLHKKDRNIITKSDDDYLIDDDGWIGHWWSNDISSYKCHCQ